MNDRTVYDHPRNTESDDEYLARKAEDAFARPIVYDGLGTPPMSERQALKALSQLGRIVYAVVYEDGVIKIGCTGSMHNRVNSLGGSKRMRILGFTFGDFSTEAAVHDALRSSRHHGREYYKPTPEVLAVINGWREAVGRPPIAA